MSTKRVWNSGTPPHVGWWNASLFKDYDVWRWWNGKYWSFDTNKRASLHKVVREANTEGISQYHILWTTYWPKNARVPRIKP